MAGALLIKHRRFTTSIFLLFLGVSSLFFLYGCSPDGTDNRRPLPLWFQSVGRVDGVNLPQLDHDNDYRQFLDHPHFYQNLSQMGWNTFRLPIDWQNYTLDNSYGALDAQKVANGLQNLRLLIERLRQIQSGRSGRMFLIVDFHQYKFGPACGGVGIPRGVINESGLNPDDGNCVFKAFDRFWRNDGNALAKWNAFARAFVQALPIIQQENQDWLVLGIEPINEPQFGFSHAVFEESLVNTFRNLKEATSQESINRQINNYLIPFYQRFLLSMKDVPGIQQLLAHSMVLFEPFLLDHIILDIPLDIGPIHTPINIQMDADGRYDGMLALRNIQGISSEIHWLAAPHHYLGALDAGFLDFIPSFLRRRLIRYPNEIIDENRIRMRTYWVAGRMAEAGMHTIIGEWGTETGLLQSNGRPGGYRSWIRHSKSAFSAYTKGSLWWRYYRDSHDSQDAMYLLTSDGISNGNNMAGNGDQILKCNGRGHNLVTLVFGHCGQTRTASNP